MSSLADLPLDLLELSPDVLKEVLEILFLGVELFKLALYSAVLCFMVGEMPLATLLDRYSS